MCEKPTVIPASWFSDKNCKCDSSSVTQKQGEAAAEISATLTPSLQSSALMTVDMLRSSISKMDHLVKKQNHYLYSPLTGYTHTHTHAERHMETFSAKELLYNELGEIGFHMESQKESLRSLSKWMSEHLLIWIIFIYLFTVNDCYFLQGLFQNILLLSLPWRSSFQSREHHSLTMNTIYQEMPSPGWERETMKEKHNQMARQDGCTVLLLVPPSSSLTETTPAAAS